MQAFIRNSVILSLTSMYVGRAAKLGWNCLTARPDSSRWSNYCAQAAESAFCPINMPVTMGFGRRFSEDWRLLHLCLVYLRSAPEQRSSPLEFTQQVQRAGAWYSLIALTSLALPLQPSLRCASRLSSNR